VIRRPIHRLSSVAGTGAQRTAAALLNPATLSLKSLDYLEAFGSQGWLIREGVVVVSVQSMLGALNTRRPFGMTNEPQRAITKRRISDNRERPDNRPLGLRRRLCSPK